MSNKETVIPNSVWSSWFWCVEGFRPAWEYLQSPEAAANSEQIWKTTRNLVLKVPLPDTFGGKTVVWKKTTPKHKLRHLLLPSLSLIEAENYLRFAALKLPMAKLLAVGEERTMGILHHATFLSEFAEGFSDGRAFCADNPERIMGKERDGFVRESLRCLAVLHDHGYFHRGFKPYNMLWKATPSSASGVDILMIDVATCKAVNSMQLPLAVRHDLAGFFWSLGFHECDIREYSELYASFRKHPVPEPDFAGSVIARLEYLIRRHDEKHHGFHAKRREWRKKITACFR